MKTVFEKNRVIPVAVFSTADEAERVTELLLEGGISVLEITVRTDAAYDCIERISGAYSEMSVGAGSVLSVDSLTRSRDAGARFAFAPCFDRGVCVHAKSTGVPFIPGIATPTELQGALEFSDVVKIFPAAGLGGPGYIKAVTAPFKLRDFSLIPTGGISEENYLDYLSLERVASCGMSYVVDSSCIAGGDYAALRERIRKIREGLSRL